MLKGSLWRLPGRLGRLLGCPWGAPRDSRKAWRGPKGLPEEPNRAALTGLELPRGGIVGPKVGAGARLGLSEAPARSKGGPHKNVARHWS